MPSKKAERKKSRARAKARRTHKKRESPATSPDASALRRTHALSHAVRVRSHHLRVVCCVCLLRCLRGHLLPVGVAQRPEGTCAISTCHYRSWWLGGSRPED